MPPKKSAIEQAVAIIDDILPDTAPSIVDTFEAVMPTVVAIGCRILNVAPDTLLTYRALPNGGVVIITGPGQKFTFTAEDLKEQPKVVRARLVQNGITILKPTRTMPPEPDLADEP